jgi:hypothetical protein
MMRHFEVAMTTTQPAAAEVEAPKYSKSGRPIGTTPEERAIMVGPVWLLKRLKQVHGAKRWDIAQELAQLPRRRDFVVRPPR